MEILISCVLSLIISIIVSIILNFVSNIAHFKKVEDILNNCFKEIKKERRESDR